MLYHKPFTSEECTYLVLLSANAQENLSQWYGPCLFYLDSQVEATHKVEFIYKESSGEGWKMST